MSVFQLHLPRASLFVLAVIWISTAPQLLWGQDSTLVERLFRTNIVSATPVFAEGQAGNRDAIIGFDVESILYEINEPIENGVIPRPRQSDPEPIGRMTAQLRCLGDAVVDKTKPMQLFVGRGRYVGTGMRFNVRGTSILHWSKDDAGDYSGIRWSDFSGAISDVQGRHAGAKGHLVGTRLLIGDPDLRAQSGLVIVRFMR
jgi:hypothetical protein